MKFIKPVFTEESHRYDSSKFKPLVTSPSYLIGEDGSVISTLDKNHKVRLRKLTPKLDKDGYPVLTIRINGLIKTVKVHRLVALMFVENLENKLQVNHIDGCKTNNHYTNLEWCTAKENAIHAVKIKLRVAMKGSKHGLSKLTEENVKQIRCSYSQGNVTQKTLADKYGVSFQTISDVVNNKLWTHV